MISSPWLQFAWGRAAGKLRRQEDPRTATGRFSHAECKVVAMDEHELSSTSVILPVGSSGFDSAPRKKRAPASGSRWELARVAQESKNTGMPLRKIDVEAFADGFNSRRGPCFRSGFPVQIWMPGRLTLEFPGFLMSRIIFGLFQKPGAPN